MLHPSDVGFSSFFCVGKNSEIEVIGISGIRKSYTSYLVFHAYFYLHLVNKAKNSQTARLS